MNMKKIALLAFTVVVLLGVSTFAQTKEEPVNDITGVWEFVGNSLNDCQTGEPLPPDVRVTTMFNQGGTLTQEDTLDLDGPFRSTGAGVWKRVSGRNYTYGYQHYSFDHSSGALTIIVNVRSNLTLSRDGNSFDERGTVQVTDPSGIVFFNGCYIGTSKRLFTSL